MRHQLTAAVMTAAVLAVALLGLSACNAEQPPLGCPVQRITWAAKYNLKESQAPVGACASKAGERLGIQTYNVPGTQENTLVIKPETLARLDAADPDHPSYSLGAWPEQAGADDFCVAPELSVAEKHVAASGDTAARDVTYKWSNVRIIARASAPGSQLIANLEYTDGACTAHYEVWGVWPSVSCADENGAPDNRVCTEPGYGLNPDFALTCDPKLLRCVPSNRPPSFR